MKKTISIALILVLVLGCLTACNFTQNLSGALAGEAEATPKVEEMMKALSANGIAEAKALLHSEASNVSDDAITQMSDYLDGREVSNMELINININTTTGTSGKARQERVGYRATLSDGAVVYLNAIYLDNDKDCGFISFQLVLGIV